MTEAGDIAAPRAPAPDVALERVRRRYGHVVALDDVSLAVPGGGFLALVGESGAGKTTVLRCLLRLDEPDAGRVLVGGRDVRDGSAVALRRALGYVPQDAGLLPHWTVRRNAALVPRLAGDRDALARADEALALVGLDPSLAGRWPHELSGGQRQRVAVARALAGGQSLLLLDEPFGALDAVTRHDLQHMLLDVRARRALTAVLVTHDVREALLLATSVAVLRAGRVEQVAPPDELRAAPATDYVARLLERSGALVALLLAVLVALALPTRATAQDDAARARSVVVASKPFGESYLLAEMAAQVMEARGIAVVRRPGLGATEVAFAALRSGAIDVYPEYTGTGLLAILRAPPTSDARAVFDTLQREFDRRWGLRWLPPLGFENTYAIAVRRATADSLGLRTLTDLARASPALDAGLTPDFIARPDGLPGLAGAYGLRFASVRPLGQALKYRALADGGVDVVDGYSTDALVARYDLAVLRDDRGFFPPYEAAYLVGARLRRDHPDAIAALTQLSGRLDERAMRRLNERVEVDGVPIDRVAREALASLGLGAPPAADAPTAARDDGDRGSFAAYLWGRRATLLALAGEHLALVGLSLLAAIAVALPLGLALERAPRAAEPVIRALGAIQTVPGIALLAFAVPLLGVGTAPALLALWLYGLFPIVRATYSGVRDADPSAAYAARALGMTPRQVLLQVRAPLAAPAILAGVRTAAVINVGTATLAAFIGAGGLGEPIATGLALADTRLILSGALPAAALALLVDGALALVERWTTPAALRARRAS